MNDKKLTPQESLSIITDMIENSQPQPDTTKTTLKISLMWAILSIVTALVILPLLMITRNPSYNYLWLAIPAIGFPANFIMSKCSHVEREPLTRLNQIRNNIWLTVGAIAIILTVICFGFNFCGYRQAWLSMLYYAFIVVGFGATAQGILLRENTYIFGGIFSIIAGFGIICAQLCGIPLLVTWVIPLYVVCFLLMFVLPAIIVSRKFK